DLNKYENYRWFIEYDGEVVGNVSVKNISQMMKYAEIGYGIGEAHQGRGSGDRCGKDARSKMFFRVSFTQAHRVRPSRERCFLSCTAESRIHTRRHSSRALHHQWRRTK